MLGANLRGPGLGLRRPVFSTQCSAALRRNRAIPSQWKARLSSNAFCAPSWGIPGSRAGQILLVELLRKIFLIDEPHGAGGRGEKTGNGKVQFAGQFGNSGSVAPVVGGHQASGEERIKQALFILRAIGVLGRAEVVVNCFCTETGFDIFAGPVAGDGGEIVSGCRGQRRYWIGGRRAELGPDSLKVQEFVAQDSKTRERLAYFILHRSQIFADDDGLVAHAFESQDTNQILRTIANIGSIPCAVPFGNPIETEQAHHVIDAESATMPHSLANRLGKEPVAIGAMPDRVGRRERPVLSIGRKAIGG